MSGPDDVRDMERSPLALAMLAAWLNVAPDHLPSTMRAHTCPSTMTAWQRVGEAALEYHRTEATAEKDRLLGIAVEALRQIACFHDDLAQARLQATGSYGSFDEPHGVQVACTALAQIRAAQGGAK
jgi:hypothetical protein